MKTELPTTAAQTVPRIVILGGGFGGLSCAKALRRAHAHVTLIDQRNFHLFQPLLYQVATAALSLADIAMPIRWIVRHQGNTQVQLGRVEAIDRQARSIQLSGHDQVIFYDYLVVATGACHTYFGHDDWAPFAPVLKTAEDAIAIRHRVLAAFEQAEVTADLDERRRLLSFVVIGGGPTGVEMAGAIAELARTELAMKHRTLRGQRARVSLVEAGPRLLTAFPTSLMQKARRSLEHLGVQVLTDTPVQLCDAVGIIAAGKRIETRTLIWAAGVTASAAAEWLGVEADKGGRVRVESDLSLPGDKNIFVIGDTAHVTNPDGQAVPGIAPPAKQEGTYVGRLLLRRLAGALPPGAFRYRNYGNLATVGRKSAIVDFGWMRMSGLPGWLTWGAAHIFFLIGFRRRVMVMLSWLWSYVTTDYGTRLIIGSRRKP
ncbi:pyridine nucleotide-disulfide oxidoreductase [Rhodanobacter thiooxydans]|uniref:NADH:ubiquinone reductase (non-electrogenic) n=1 Tax=Rhodanobacter thiooxydans TaxID=416169 RepID=A0A154QMH7_9GAMM|nr:NAD(P)/FAD-dependent oxidoreductase [Rhodanobacter thiooxydans]EIM00530.1 NADH dehydrogenase [Rhodanobacter thiooxydans LCS2]KZC25301.1 pyridine nucleotide-disulfide oxidoreductase [Rhodanobacter thiooxydans]MCW0200902.1 NAD(P)/FAD-dependent oxidoreductase [Rhodanobacter thiooxydans]